MPDAGDVTRLLNEADRGNLQAHNELFVLVEDDLRKIARKRKRKVGGGDADACTTALVDDAFLRIVGKEATCWQAGDRRKFFAYVSTKVHDLLIDGLRKQQAQVRGGDRQAVEFVDDHAEPARGGAGDLGLLLDLQNALGRLQEFALNDAILFRVRFFLDCTFEEAAEMLNMSKTEAVRSYQRTQLWLRRELKEYNLDA